MMSRTGPAYVESELDLFADPNLKQKNGYISDETTQAFLDLYEFTKEIGYGITISGEKNANFQVKVDAHQGDTGLVRLASFKSRLEYYEYLID